MARKYRFQPNSILRKMFQNDEKKYHLISSILNLDGSQFALPSHEEY